MEENRTQVDLRQMLEEILQLDRAILAAILQQTGPIEIPREAVQRSLREKRQVYGAFRGERIVLWVQDASADADGAKAPTAAADGEAEPHV